MDLKEIAKKVASETPALPKVWVVSQPGDIVGVAVGFRPSDEVLEKMGAFAEDGWALTGDDGTSEPASTWMMDPGDKSEFEILAMDWDAALDSGRLPFGEDVAIWRSEEELAKDAADYEGGEYVGP